MQDINAVNIVTNPKLYKLLYRFYEAGYEQRRYPRPLNQVRHSIRPVLRRVYREGATNYRDKLRLSRMLHGA